MIENNIIRKINCTDQKDKISESLLRCEWLVTNGIGGYASGTISGIVTRRYHGLLIAALPNPFGRTLMLNHLSETFISNEGKEYEIGGEEKGLNVFKSGKAEYLSEFKLELGLPVWRFEFDDYVVQKKILLPHKQNSVLIYYKLLSGPAPLTLSLRPSMHFRGHEFAVNSGLAENYRIIIKGRKYEVATDPDLPLLKLYFSDKKVSLDISSDMTREIYYRLEADRGYEFKGSLWSPGKFKLKLKREKEIVITASTEEWDTILDCSPPDLYNEDIERRKTLLEKAGKISENKFAAELILAADQFIITPVGRESEERKLHGQDEPVRTVIAGYHWFTDWGRDTMISLEGLTLATGRLTHAKWILRTFAHYVKNGLIPNMFPEGEEEGLYHTADASLWFFHAVERYLTLTNDYGTLKEILPKLHEIIDTHIEGTEFGIYVDQKDGLLVQGQEHYQLTWMDAKVEDWVVTPRRGKAVEINALWYNALCLFENWIGQEKGNDSVKPYREQIKKARDSFNLKFWYKKGGYLYDIIEGENEEFDTACRPNQVLSISLLNPVLDKNKWEGVMNVVKDRLLTPVGLRSLAPGHPDYKEKYFGDLRARDAAYHQGTVWAWLIGPFVDAWVKVYPEDKQSVKKFIEGFEVHLSDACIGTISEIFDAEPPFHPRGCIAQAWSVAEVLRCFIKLNSIGKV